MSRKECLYLFCGAFIVALWLLHRKAQFSQLWCLISVLMVLPAFMALVWFERAARGGWHRLLMWGVGGALLANALGSIHIYGRLSDELPRHEEDGIFRLQLQVAGLPQVHSRSVQFPARVLAARPAGVPEIVLVRWFAPGWGGPYQQPVPYAFPDIAPGQLWQMTVVLRSPHGVQNPFGFDYEQFVFAQGLRAVASVRGQPRQLSAEELWTDFRVAAHRPSLALLAQQWRYRLKEIMQPFLAGERWGRVVAALTIGDRSDFDDEDWLLFNRAGLTHLISISGTHITLVAGSIGTCLWLLLRHLPYVRELGDRQPVVLWAALAALAVAALYSAIAGWGVPARRSFFMLAVGVVAYWGRLLLPPALLLLLVAVAVLAIDPWAMLSTGFWLSFGAVAVLIACAHWSGRVGPGVEQQKWGRRYQKFKQFVLWQIIITVLLWPMLVWFFSEFSIASVISNLYAIPLLGTLATPLSLLFALSAWAFGAHWLTETFLQLALFTIDITMRPTEWLVEQPWSALMTARAPWWVFGGSVVGLLIALLPRFTIWQRLGWLTVLPVLFWPGRDLGYGEWRLEVLDVGQGLALVIQTRDHNYLYDVGGRSSPFQDQGKRVVLPHLQARGVEVLEGIVVSHADLDHVGGLRSIMEAMPVRSLYSSFPLVRWWQYENERLGQSLKPAEPDFDLIYCRDGVQWEVDGVRFRFLWPQRPMMDIGSNSAQRNAFSCVLEIQGAHHAALLLGDISHDEEKAILNALSENGYALVIASHHGSRHGSSPALTRTVQPCFAVASTGWWNRFQHPHPETRRRWQQVGALFLTTHEWGAMSFESRGRGLDWQARRWHHRRYWHNPMSVSLTAEPEQSALQCAF